MECPGYVTDDEVTIAYPWGQAWHRFKEREEIKDGV